jgi:hypothetical protein
LRQLHFLHGTSALRRIKTGASAAGKSPRSNRSTIARVQFSTLDLFRAAVDSALSEW